MKQHFNLTRISILLSFLFVAVLPLNVSANCLIPGYPGCTQKDFYNALDRQRAQDDYQAQLKLQRENNQLLQEQNDLLRSQQFNQFQNNNMQSNKPGLFGACSGKPLTTPGCWGNR